jgi:hypothetical protein
MIVGPADPNVRSAAPMPGRSRRGSSWLVALALILAAMGGSLWLLGSLAEVPQPRIVRQHSEAEPELESPPSPTASPIEVTPHPAAPDALPDQFAALVLLSQQPPVTWSGGSEGAAELSDEPDLIHVVSAPGEADGSAAGAWLTGEIEFIADPPALSRAGAVEDLSGRR